MKGYIPFALLHSQHVQDLFAEVVKLSGKIDFSNSQTGGAVRCIIGAHGIKELALL